MNRRCCDSFTWTRWRILFFFTVSLSNSNTRSFHRRFVEFIMRNIKIFVGIIIFIIRQSSFVRLNSTRSDLLRVCANRCSRCLNWSIVKFFRISYCFWCSDIVFRYSACLFFKLVIDEADGELLVGWQTIFNGFSGNVCICYRLNLMKTLRKQFDQATDFCQSHVVRGDIRTCWITNCNKSWRANSENFLLFLFF